MDLEIIPDTEAEQIDRIVDLTAKQIQKRYTSPAKTLRGVHPKDHGCVQATFSIKSDLAPHLRVGLFANVGTEFQAAIRFSNAATLVLPDSTEENGKPVQGSRGMAIKVKGVPDPDSNGTLVDQDWLMVNHPVFAFANVEDYEVLSRVILEDNESPSRFFALQAMKQGDAATRASETLKIVGRIRSANFQPPPCHPAQNRYFSGAPFAFGPTMVMKYSAIPHDMPTQLPVIVEPDYLRKNLINRLDPRGGNEPVTFDFAVQVRDAQSLNVQQDIENASCEWSEADFPYIPVATITIRLQDFDSPEAKQACEEMFLTPWHTLQAHRPLGGINRLRKKVYEKSLSLRLGRGEQRPQNTTH
jgi:hypothetical protein